MLAACNVIDVQGIVTAQMSDLTLTTVIVNTLIHTSELMGPSSGQTFTVQQHIYTDTAFVKDSLMTFLYLILFSLQMSVHLDLTRLNKNAIKTKAHVASEQGSHWLIESKFFYLCVTRPLEMCQPCF